MQRSKCLWNEWDSQTPQTPHQREASLVLLGVRDILKWLMLNQLLTHYFSLWAIFESLHQAPQTLGSAEFCPDMPLGAQVSLAGSSCKEPLKTGEIQYSTKIGAKRARELLNLENSNRHINLDESIIYQRTIDKSVSPGNSRDAASASRSGLAGVACFIFRLNAHLL